MMYADSYMTKGEFREMFDHTLYDEMRQKYQCTKAFPDVYDKVNKAARTGVSTGLNGVNTNGVSREIK